MILPLVWLHSFMPFLTEGGYGVYALKPDATWCYLHGGAGIFSHDLHIAVVMTYFSGCAVVIILSVYKASRVIKEVVGLITREGVSSSNALNNKWVEVEKRCLWFAVTLSSGFLLTWTLTATHIIFLVLPGGSSRHWFTLFFNFSILCIPVGLLCNPLIHVYFDPYLQELLYGLFQKAKKKTTNASDFVFKRSYMKHFACTANNRSGESGVSGRS